MPDLPALPLGQPEPRQRQTGSPHRARLSGPGPESQAERLGPSFERLSRAFDQGRVEVSDEPGPHEPELVLVLEIAGEIDEFAAAVRRVPGLEFLAEEALEKLDPDEFAVVDSQGRPRPYARQLLVLMSDRSAWEELISMWERYKRGEDPQRGFAKFRDLFEQLKELRPWNDSDRLERTGAAEVWANELAGLEDELVDFEIELWRRESSEARERTISTLTAGLARAGGTLVSQFEMPEIDYHGALGRVPASKLLEAAEHYEVRWLSTEGVRFFRAAGQISSIGELNADELTDAPHQAAARSESRDPQVAVLDGVPLSGHRVLAGRLLLDDPDGWQELTSVERRVHGTGIASVVLHGDLAGDSPSLVRPVYTRPVLTSNAPEWVPNPTEELPRDRLAVDLIHSAVARMFVDSDASSAVAPTVRVVVLAIGDSALQFDRFVSPLARLLDWLSVQFGVLFVVPAGNHLGPLTIPADTGLEDPQEIQHEVLCAIRKNAAYRRLLSPAEAINVLTIGAAHADAATDRADDDRVDPIVTPDLPTVSTALGGGLRRSVKPEVLLPGGRQLIRLEPINEASQTRLATVPATRRAPGVLVAAPSPTQGHLDAAVHAVGTSVATGMAGHSAGHLLARLSELREIHGDRFPGPEFDVVLLKAAMIHGARWGSARSLVASALEEIDAPQSRESIARQLGYGAAAPERAIECDTHIVTALAAGQLTKDSAHAYRFPLPPSLASRTEHRRVTLTLAWFSPINPRHRNYRRAHLKLEPDAPGAFLGSRTDNDQNQSRRGTSQHDVLEGDRAVPFAPGAAIELVVSCRADAGAMESSVPYGIFATVDVPQELHLEIYEEVRHALRVPVGVRINA